jgi:hypothetical protein
MSKSASRHHSGSGESSQTQHIPQHSLRTSLHALLAADPGDAVRGGGSSCAFASVCAAVRCGSISQGGEIEASEATTYKNTVSTPFSQYPEPLNYKPKHDHRST